MKQGSKVLMAFAIVVSVYASLASADVMQVMEPLPGGQDTHVNAVSSNNTLCGTSDASDGFRHAAISTQLGGTVDLGTNGFESECRWIDNDDTAYGTQDVPGDGTQGFVKTSGGTKILTGTLGGLYTYLYHGEGGLAVGESKVDDGDENPSNDFSHAVVYIPGSSPIDTDALGITCNEIADSGSPPAHLCDLGTLGGDNSSATVITGTLIGGSSQTTGNASRHPFAFDLSGGGMVDIAENTSSNGNVTHGHGGNLLLGYEANADNSQQIAFYRLNGTKVFLGTLGGDTSLPGGTDGTTITGNSKTIDNAFHTFSYDIETGVMTNVDLPYGESGGVGVEDDEIAGNGSGGSEMASIAELGTRSVGSPRGYRYKDGVLSELPTLGGDFSSAVGMSGRNIPGNTTTSLFNERGVVYIPNTCPATPQSCRGAGKSSLTIKNKPKNTKDSLMWKWINGESTSPTEFGTPTSGGSYTLCLYAGTASANIGEVNVPDDSGNWQVTGTGFKYGAGNPNGIKLKTILKASDSDKAKIIFKASGQNLPELPLGAIDVPITMQLIGSNTSACWGAVYSDGVTQDTTSLKVKSP